MPMMVGRNYLVSGVGNEEGTNKVWVELGYRDAPPHLKMQNEKKPKSFIFQSMRLNTLDFYRTGRTEK